MSHEFTYQRDRMVRLVEARGVSDARVLEAMRAIPAHWAITESTFFARTRPP